MAGASYRIDIRGNAPATFSSKNLNVTSGDVVYWSNQTSHPHELWETDAQGNQLGVPLGAARWQVIEPLHPSSAWIVPLIAVGGTRTVYYRCIRHAGETGTITITNPGP